MSTADPAQSRAQSRRRLRQARGRRPARDLRHHRRSREGDDLPLALPPRAAQAAGLPDHRRGGRRLDASSSCASTPALHRRRAARRSTRRCSSGSPARLSYVSGDFGDDGHLRARCATRSATRSSPVFYLEIPPFLFGMVIRQLGRRGADEDRPAWWSRSRSATTSPPRARSRRKSTSTSTSPSSTGSTTSSARWAPTSSCTCASRNTMIEPIWNRNHIASVQITMAEDFGVEDRGHFYDPVGALRDVVVNHLMQLVAAGRDGGARRRRRGNAEGRQVLAVPLDRGRRSAPTTCAASTTATARSTAWRRTRRTETYAAMRLMIDNWRWSGVPWFIRTGKRLPVTQTELRAVFRDAAAAGVHGPAAPPPRAQPARGQARPLDGRAPDRGRPPRRRRRARRRSRSTWSSPQEGGEAPTPYEVLLLDAMRGDSTRFTRQDGVEETWRIFEPLLEQPPPVHPYAPGSWGPTRRTGWSAASAAGAARGCSHEPRRKRSEETAGNARAAANGAGADGRDASRCRRARRCPRRSRRSPTTRSCPTATPARWWPRTERSTGCASRASTRRACSARCWTARPAPSASGRSGSTCPRRGSTSRARTSC